MCQISGELKEGIVFQTETKNQPMILQVSVPYSCTYLSSRELLGQQEQGTNLLVSGEGLQGRSDSCDALSSSDCLPVPRGAAVPIGRGHPPATPRRPPTAARATHSSGDKAGWLLLQECAASSSLGNLLVP